ncbi:MAG: SRPBCC family protein [Halioglobus sp.]|nr:SRPBCC family protein [Halioglobus sp.]
MQEHQYSFEIDASPEEIWAVFWDKKTGDVMEHGNLRIEILHGGDEKGEGLIRHCRFPVPRYLLSGGQAQSWEWITQVKAFESWRYDAVGKPLWSRATGWTRLESLGSARTRVHFRETYHVFNPVMRFFLERLVHKAISKDNDRKIKSGIIGGLKARSRKLGQSVESPAPER